jgi:hypothetical protein
MGCEPWSLVEINQRFGGTCCLSVKIREVFFERCGSRWRDMAFTWSTIWIFIFHRSVRRLIPDNPIWTVISLQEFFPPPLATNWHTCSTRVAQLLNCDGIFQSLYYGGTEGVAVSPPCLQVMPTWRLKGPFSKDDDLLLCWTNILASVSLNTAILWITNYKGQAY